MPGRFVRFSLAFLVPLTGPAVAQPASVQGPVSGFVYLAASRSVRPLVGVPGSAFMGPVLLSEIDWASIAPGGRWALVTKEGCSRIVRGMSEVAPSESAVDGLIGAVDRVVWSREGNVAALYSSSQGQLQRVRFSDSEVTVDTPVTISSLGTVAVLAIDSSGRQIVLGVTGSEAGGLYLLQPGQETPVRISTVAQPVAATFDETGGRLYAFDVDSQRILEFDDGAGGFEFASPLRPGEPALNPTGLAVSGNGRYLLVVDSTTRAVQVYETASRILVNTINLDFTPTRFEPLSIAPSFLLNGDSSKEWLLILDAGQIPAVYFVPAGREELQ